MNSGLEGLTQSLAQINQKIADFEKTITSTQTAFPVWENLSAEAKMKWDAVVFHRLLEGSPILKSLAEAPTPRVIKNIARECSYFYTDNTYEDLSSNFKSKHRNNLKRKGKRLESLGQTEFMYSLEKKNILRDLDVFLEVEASGYKGETGLGSAILCDDNLVKFYRLTIISCSA